MQSQKEVLRIVIGSLIGLILSAVLRLIFTLILPSYLYYTWLTSFVVGSFAGGYYAGKRGWLSGVLAFVSYLFILTAPILLFTTALGGVTALLDYIRVSPIFLKIHLPVFISSSLAGALGGLLRMKIRKKDVKASKMI